MYTLEDYAETQTIKGYEVETINDTYAQNPYDDMDGLVPLLAYSDRHYQTYGEDIRDFVESKIEVDKSNAKKILDYLIELDGIDGQSRMTYIRGIYEYDLCDSIANRLREIIDLNEFEVLEFMCDLFNIDYLNTTSRGCQSNYADLFIVLTDEWYKFTGCDKNASKETKQQWLEDAKKLWSSWAWGNVYGYNITLNGEDIDSVWGFYGEDHQESGLAEYVTSVIDHDIEQRRKKKIEQTKTFIKNRVPLFNRLEVSL